MFTLDIKQQYNNPPNNPRYVSCINSAIKCFFSPSKSPSHADGPQVIVFMEEGWGSLSYDPINMVYYLSFSINFEAVLGRGLRKGEISCD